MKTLRAIIYILLFATGAIVLVWFLYGYINSLLVSNPPISGSNSPEISVEQSPSSITSPATTTPEQPSGQSSDNAATGSTGASQGNMAQVSIATPAELANSYFQAVGTVQSTSLATLFPLTSGAVKSVNFREGDYVKAGSVLVELTGGNLSDHQSLTQLQIAETGLFNAKKSLENLQKSSDQGMKTAALQLQSAHNQTAALAYDLGVIEQNRSGLEDSLSIIYDSLSAVESKNSRDEIKGRRDIDDLIFTLNDAQDNRSRTQRQLEDLRDRLNDLEDQQSSTTALAGSQSTDPADGSYADSLAALSSDVSLSANAGLSQEITTTEAQLGQLQAALDAQDKGIEELYGAIDKAKYGLNTAQDAAALTANQLLGQIAQSESQARVLDITLQSTRTKLGYDDSAGGSSDVLRLAEQAYQSTRVQLQTALDSASTGVKLAELNLELARSQAAALQIRTPFDGVIISLPYSAGQNVGPQQAVAEILDPRSFELEVGVDITTAERISASAPALIELGGRQIEVPIKSISLKVDDQTRQVKLRLALPNIFFKLNQTLKVQLPLATGIAGGEPAPGQPAAPVSRFIPLDAVIIGTENQFVFVNEGGRAKKTDVEVGQIVGDRIEILSGLPSDALVVVSGARKLVDGQEISVIGW